MNLLGIHSSRQLADASRRHFSQFNFYTFARMAFLICLILASSRL
jgi:hypothetical protein